ncbi:MAG: regulatory signaling modulator protein AmpE [Gammaproteobacteria bacterium]|nr:regulatory signaling modulator protein AmpE [Gammaproteobacteria bacterium]
MSLLVILVVSAIELTLAPLAQVRETRWVTAWHDWLGNELSGRSWWDGTPGLLLLVAVPMLAVGLLYGWIGALGAIFAFAFATLLALYCLGPGDLNQDIDRILQAGSDAERTEAGAALAVNLEDRSGDAAELTLRGIVVAAHDRLFAPLFWLVVLGPAGIVLYRIVAVLRQGGGYGGMADAARHLHSILCWVPERLFALGFGIAGSLQHAFDAWRATEDYSLEHGQTMMTRVALAALLPVAEADAEADTLVSRVRALCGLLNRSYIVWLTLLAALLLASLAG